MRWSACVAGRHTRRTPYTRIIQRQRKGLPKEVKLVASPRDAEALEISPDVEMKAGALPETDGSQKLRDGVEGSTTHNLFCRTMREPHRQPAGLDRFGPLFFAERIRCDAAPLAWSPTLPRFLLGRVCLPNAVVKEGHPALVMPPVHLAALGDMGGSEAGKEGRRENASKTPCRRRHRRRFCRREAPLTTAACAWGR